MKLRAAARSILMMGLTLLASGVLISCVPDTSAPLLQSRRKPTGTPPTTPEQATTPHAALRPFTDFDCLNCHTDQEQLVALAVEKPAAESLSEGPG